MEKARQRVLEKDRKRYSVLKAIYTGTDGQKDKAVTFNKVFQVTGLPGEEIIQVLEYLEAEELVKPKIDYSGGGFIWITHKGVIEIEASIKNPETSTEHFPAQVFHTYIYGTLGVLQQAGEGNIARANQNIASSEVDDLVVKLSNLIKSSSLDDLDRDVTEASLNGILELAKQEQSQSVIKKVKKRLDLATETIKKYKPTYDIAKPILVAIYNFFKISFGG
jgi:hypothetical protein